MQSQNSEISWTLSKFSNLSFKFLQVIFAVPCVLSPYPPIGNSFSHWKHFHSMPRVFCSFRWDCHCASNCLYSSMACVGPYGLLSLFEFSSAAFVWFTWAVPENRWRSNFIRQCGPGELPTRKRYGEKALISRRLSAFRTRDRMTYVVIISVRPGRASMSPQSA